MAQPTQVRQSPAMEDRMRAQRDLNTPIACERCNGRYFEEVKIYQYAALSYGNNDYKLLSPSAKNVLRCLCGKLRVPPARHVPGSPQIKQSYEDYSFSTQVADEFICSLSPEAFAKSAASPAELEQLKHDLEAKIAALDTKLKEKPVEAKKKKTDPQE